MSDRVFRFDDRIRSVGIVIGSGDGDLVQLLRDALVHGDEHDLVRLRGARVVDLREGLRDGRDGERVSAGTYERRVQICVLACLGLSTLSKTRMKGRTRDPGHRREHGHAEHSRRKRLNKRLRLQIPLLLKHPRAMMPQNPRRAHHAVREIHCKAGVQPRRDLRAVRPERGEREEEGDDVLDDEEGVEAAAEGPCGEEHEPKEGDEGGDAPADVACAGAAHVGGGLVDVHAPRDVDHGKRHDHACAVKRCLYGEFWGGMRTYHQRWSTLRDSYENPVAYERMLFFDVKPMRMGRLANVSRAQWCAIQSMSAWSVRIIESSEGESTHLYHPVRRISARC